MSEKIEGAIQALNGARMDAAGMTWPAAIGKRLSQGIEEALSILTKGAPVGIPPVSRSGSAGDAVNDYRELIDTIGILRDDLNANYPQRGLMRKTILRLGALFATHAAHLRELQASRDK